MRRVRRAASLYTTHKVSEKTQSYIYLRTQAGMMQNGPVCIVPVMANIELEQSFRVALCR